MTDARRVRVVVSGFVQAVGFRSGWVRNNADGTVEAELEGPPDRVEALIDWFRHGPRGARVDRIDLEPLEPMGVQGFVIR